MIGTKALSSEKKEKRRNRRKWTSSWRACPSGCEFRKIKNWKFSTHFDRKFTKGFTLLWRQKNAVFSAFPPDRSSQKSMQKCPQSIFFDKVTTELDLFDPNGIQNQRVWKDSSSYDFWKNRFSGHFGAEISSGSHVAPEVAPQATSSSPALTRAKASPKSKNWFLSHPRYVFETEKKLVGTNLIK